MNLIKSFKVFESNMVSIKDLNDDYQYLKDILQSELFDELNIQTIDRDIKGFDDFDEQPKHKFWSYYKSGSGYTCNLDNNSNEKVDSIIVFNLIESDKEKVNNILEGLVSLIKDSLGYELIWSIDEVIGEWDYYDCMIKLLSEPSE